MTTSKARTRESDRKREVQLAYESMSPDERAQIDYAAECLMVSVSKRWPQATFGPMQAREVLMCLGRLIDLHVIHNST